MPLEPRDDRQHGAGVRGHGGFFPVDEMTLEYLRLTGRDEALIATGRGSTARLQGLWRDDAARSSTATVSSSTSATSSRRWPGRSARRTASPARHEEPEWHPI
jgi:hypothetical protein